MFYNYTVYTIGLVTNLHLPPMFVTRKSEAHGHKIKFIKPTTLISEANKPAKVKKNKGTTLQSVSDYSEFWRR
jgi:hypothetical protein